MIYEEALRYIKNVQRAGIDLGLERMRELLDLAGAPDAGLNIVHIAGTNGKGSVSAYLTEILRAAGYKVGTYNSPSVFCYNERWLVDGSPISDDDVARYMTEVADIISRENSKRADGGFCPTAFEIETAVAFLAFAGAKADVCVIETGLGGRWDATNAVRSKLLSVITPIGLDHCAYLGNSLGEIAAEKAAIICGDAVTCAQCDEIMRELAHPYKTKGNDKVYLPCDLNIAGEPKPISSSLDGQRFLYEGEEYFIQMLGEHQLTNAAIAVCAAQKLNQKGFVIRYENIKEGLARTVWHGRFEIVKNAKERFNIVVPNGKTLIFDGAHNPHGAASLEAALKKYFAGKKLHLVMGAFGDKDVEGVVRLIAPLAARATAVQAPPPRGMKADELKNILAKYVPCDIGQDVRGALQAALLGDCDVVLLAGSLSLFECLASGGENH